MDFLHLQACKKRSSMSLPARSNLCLFCPKLSKVLRRQGTIPKLVPDRKPELMDGNERVLFGLAENDSSSSGIRLTQFEM